MNRLLQPADRRRNHGLRRKSLQAPLLLTLIAVILSVVPAQAEHIPTYGGRTFEAWQRLTLTDLDPETRFRGMLAVGRLGLEGDREPALETLRTAIAEEPVPIVRSAGYLAILLFGEQAWPTVQRGLRSPDLGERRVSLYAVADFFAPVPLPASEMQLAALPSQAELPTDAALVEQLIPLLIEIFEDRGVDSRDRQTAARALGGIFQSHPPTEILAEPVLAAAEEVARSAELELASAAIRIIGHLGPHARSALPWLMEIAQRQERVRSIRDLEGQPSPDEGRLLSRPIAAVETLGYLGRFANDAIPLLEKMQDRTWGREIYTAGLARRAIAEIRADLARSDSESR